MIFLYLLIFVMPLTNHPLWSRTLGDLTVFKYLGGACVFYAVFHLTVRQVPLAFLRTWQARFFIILCIVASWSYFTKALQKNLEYSPIFSYLSFLLLFIITISVVDSIERLRRVLMVTVGSVAFGSLYVIREWQKSGYAEGRPGWIVGDSNVFAITAVVCLPLAFYLMLGQRPRWERSFYAGSLLVTLVAVLLGASRGGCLGLLAGFLFAVLRSRRRGRNLALASILLVPASLFLPSSPIQRFLHPTWVDKASIESRNIAWHGGISMIASHPLLGVGLGNYKPLVTQYEAPGEDVKSIAHNTYIEIGAELGLPALLMFLAILVSTYRSLERVRRQAARSGPRLLELAALGIEGGLVGYCVGAFFLSAEYQKFFWLVIFLSMCLPVLVRPVSAKQKRGSGRWLPVQSQQEPANRRRKAVEARLVSRALERW
jgi:O-antigen ligase